MNTITISVHDLSGIKEALKKAPAKLKAEMQSALQYASILTQRIEKEQAPIDRGYLRGSIDRRAEGDMGVIIWPRANYAAFVNQGTGIYGPSKQRIYPTKAKVLAWKAGGKTIFARSIKGQKANPFVDRTRDLAEPEVVEAFNKAVDNTLNG